MEDFKHALLVRRQITRSTVNRIAVAVNAQRLSGRRYCEQGLSKRLVTQTVHRNLPCGEFRSTQEVPTAAATYEVRRAIPDQ